MHLSPDGPRQAGDASRSVENDLHDTPILMIALGRGVWAEIAHGWPDVEHHLAQTWPAATGHVICAAGLRHDFEAVGRLECWVIDPAGHLSCAALHTAHGDLLLLPVSVTDCEETLRQRIVGIMAPINSNEIDAALAAVRSLNTKEYLS